MTHPFLAFLMLIPPVPLLAQADSRAEQIEAERRKKAAQLTPETTSRLESVMVAIKEDRILEKILYGFHGLRPLFGGLVTGSGFAFGAQFLQDELAGGSMVLSTSARVSTRLYERYDFSLDFPRLAGNKAFAGVLAVRRNLPQMNYYGPGPNSSVSRRTDYRLEDTSVDATAGLLPLPRMRLGATGGYVAVNVGPGADRRFVNTERVFTPLEAPGISRQTNFLRSVFFAQYDWRDIPGGPRSGGNYTASYGFYWDRTLHQHTFRRLELEAQQYLPLLNRRRVIALRGKSVLSDAGAGQRVPFYMQPVLGGSDDLRGFRRFRFYDDNMLVFNAEYRYEIFAGMDMAVFGDAGKVFARRAQWNLRNLEGAYGIGMRFNARNNVFLRLDLGKSHEGTQLWFKFGNVF
ncbi:MAG: BamA/TamA family outer membrane protein [Acidobacteria bacterium]|nr:BamA/TamA family outer membrane protein [Acidobacteriota bacterium]